MDDTTSRNLSLFFKRFKRRTFKTGQYLVRAADEPSGVFYLTKGTVKQYTISSKGEEIVLNLFKPISFFPMSWAINQTPNAYFFEAAQDVECWLAPREAVIAFVRANPDVLFDLISRVYIGIDGVLNRMYYLMSGSTYTRLITELLIHVKRFGTKVNGEPIYYLQISEKELANQTGMARETVSRELKTLKDKGLISFKRHALVVTDLGALERELSLTNL